MGTKAIGDVTLTYTTRVVCSRGSSVPIGLLSQMTPFCCSQSQCSVLTTKIVSRRTYVPITSQGEAYGV